MIIQVVLDLKLPSIFIIFTMMKNNPQELFIFASVSCTLVLDCVTNTGWTPRSFSVKNQKYLLVISIFKDDKSSHSTCQ